ncbi:MAG: hypothetical protein KAH05_08880, partial [Clostridiales bacterium]|nr:hypothetical protein [Clostridiales bacterium]
MTNKKDTPKILLDADVVSHFIKGGQLLILPKLYPNQLVILNKVKKELKNIKNVRFKTQVDNFLRISGVEQKDFPEDFKVIKEYARLKKELSLGEGESACLAFARFDEKYMVASSNLSDIEEYCRENNIIYLPTMDILVAAYNKGMLTKDECNNFITTAKNKGSRLPCNTIE